MNKVFNINLGGYPFIIDDNAYDHLKGYLKVIHQHFKDSDGYEEITTDIEIRMAEIFRKGHGPSSIVTMKTVQSAIDIMGTPADFGAEDFDNIFANEGSESHQHQTNSKYRTGRKLFRDPDSKIISGVASGISAYLGVEDPLWVRMGFVLFMIAGGFAIPLYVILWAITPEPKNSSDRLAMRGKPVTASNIGKIIEEGINEIGDEIEDFSKKVKKKSNQQNKGFLNKITKLILHIVQYFLNLLNNLINLAR